MRSFVHGKRPSKYRFQDRQRSRARRDMALNKRDDVLLRLGFASYSGYLKSAMWATIREMKLNESPTCEVCQKTEASQVHHLWYSLQILSGKNMRMLVSVCGNCHRIIEFTEDGRKRTTKRARQKTKQLMRINGAWSTHEPPSCHAD